MHFPCWTYLNIPLTSLRRSESDADERIDVGARVALVRAHEGLGVGTGKDNIQ